jgi:sulfur carrier protein ThiS
VVVEVNGEPVDPSQYVIQGTETASAADQGDHIRVVVRTNATGS